MKFSYLALSVLTAAMPLLAADTAQERLQDATTTFSEVMRTPDKSIPQKLLDDAACAVIVPGVKKGAFIVGAKYGKGFAVCRENRGKWGAPAGVILEGGSVGFQIGASNTDVVMLVMNSTGMRRLLQDKFTIGAGASAAGGPVGRNVSALTDAQISADILTWSRSKGLFAGIDLTGAVLREDQDANNELYGKKLTNQAILEGHMKSPAAAAKLDAALDRYSPKENPTRPVETRVEHGITGSGNADRSTDTKTKQK